MHIEAKLTKLTTKVQCNLEATQTHAFLQNLT